MRFILILLITFVLSSCSSSPTTADNNPSTALDIKKAKNSNDLADLIISEIWNKKVSNFMPKNEYPRKKMTIVSKKLQRRSASPIVGTSYSDKPINYNIRNKCNSDPDNPNLMILSKATSSPIVEMTMALKPHLAVLNDKCEYPRIDYSRNLATLTAVDYPVYKAEKLVNLLKDRGIPLHFCFDEISAKSIGTKREGKYQNMVCTIDDKGWTRRGIYVSVIRNVTIATKLDQLAEVKFQDIRINRNDLSKSYAEIYKNNWQNQKYREAVLKHHKIIYNQWYRKFIKTVRQNAKFDAKMAAEKRARKKAYWDILGSSIAGGAAKFNNSRIGLSDPRIQSLGKKSFSLPTSTDITNGTSIGTGNPKDTDKINKSAVKNDIVQKKNTTSYNSLDKIKSDPTKKNVKSNSVTKSDISPKQKSHSSNSISLNKIKKDSTKKNVKKPIPRLIPIFVQKENINSWKTQESACYYAKQVAKRAAVSECRRKYGGETASKSDIGIPVDANCQSYRQNKKGTIWHTKDHWRVTGNIILQCKLPN